MQKALQTCRNQLEELKGGLKTRTRFFMQSAPERIEEPTYDVKVIDKMVTKINNVLFRMDAAIKAKNAVTTIDIDIDYDDLAAEIQ